MKGINVEKWYDAKLLIWGECLGWKMEQSKIVGGKIKSSDLDMVIDMGDILFK